MAAEHSAVVIEAFDRYGLVERAALGAADEGDDGASF